MSNVIEFPGKEIEVSLEGADPQLLLECSIVHMWETLGGNEIKAESFAYHVFFLKFADACFTAMEDDLFQVDKEGGLAVAAELVDALREYINEFKRKAATNDN
jgi:hypothetical protein